MNDELISVVIPVWNPNITYLKECIDSVIEQSYANLEIIVVYQKKLECDEKFYDLMNKYKDSRLKVITSKKGVSIARNVGIEYAKGKYIANIDADDICEKDRFEKQMKFKKSKKYNVVGSRAHRISNDGKIIGKIIYPTEHVEIRKKIMLHDFILNPTVLMDKDIFREVGLFDESLLGAEDYDLWFRALAAGFRFGNIPEFLVRIRENPNSITRGEEWKKHRKYSMNVRNKAFSQYGFRKPRDVLYHFLTPLSFLISPNLLLKIKKLMGWYQ